MDVTFAKAAQAYANKPAALGGESATTGAKSAGSSFADMLGTAAEGAVSTMKSGEVASMQAVSGDASLTDVVQAVTQAEITLQTVVNIRDTLIESYQRIIQMPI